MFGSGFIAAAVSGALLVGAGVGVVLEQTNAVDFVQEGTVIPPLDPVSFSLCPGEEAIGELQRGDRVFVTGRDVTGTWLAVRSPFDTSERIWVEAAHVLPDRPTGDLELAACDDRATSEPDTDGELPLATERYELISPTTTSVPGQTTATIAPEAPSPTTPAAPDLTPSEPHEPLPSPTEPTPTPETPTPNAPTTTTTGPPTEPTEPVDDSGPEFDSISVWPSDIWEDASYGGCPTQHRTATVKASAKVDAPDVASMTLRIQVGAVDETVTMEKRFGEPWVDHFGTVGPFADDTVASDSPVTLTVTATDVFGNTSSATNSSLVLHDCTID